MASDGPGVTRRAKGALGRSLRAVNHYAGDALTRLPDGSSAVLMYHSVGDRRLPMNAAVDRLEATLEFLTDAAFVDVVDLPEVLDCSTRRRKVALTFDDGFANFHDRVVPLLERYGAPATVFVNPGFLDDADRDLLQQRHEMRSEGQIVMSAGQLREVVASPLVTVGNHTVTHPRLDHLDRARARKEILAGKRALEARFGLSVTRFAYPYGRYDEDSVDVVRRTHNIAVVIGPGVVTPGTDPHLVPRLLAHESPSKLRWLMTRARHLDTEIRGGTGSGQ